MSENYKNACEYALLILTRSVGEYSDLADEMHEQWLEEYHALGNDYKKLFELMSSVIEHNNYFEPNKD